MPRPNPGPRLKWIERRQSFYIVWYEFGQQRLRATGCADLRDAQIELAAHLGNVVKRPNGPRDPAQFPIAEAINLYAVEKAPKAKAPERIAYAVDALLPFWGESMVADITEPTCDRYVKDRQRAPATVRRELTTLRAAINYCVAAGYLTRGATVMMPPKPDGKDRWLTQSEAARLLWAARSGRRDVRRYLPLFILIALYTGARKEAILSLRWSQVDLAHGRINFARAGEARTKKGRAHISVPDRLMTFLRLARKRDTDLGYVIHDNGARIKDIGSSWTGNDAQPGSFGNACKRAGLKGVGPHTLRHTCGTWMALAGVDLWKIAGWLGQSLATTTELYAHHHPDHMADAKKAADRRK